MQNNSLQYLSFKEHLSLLYEIQQKDRVVYRLQNKHGFGPYHSPNFFLFIEHKAPRFAPHVDPGFIRLYQSYKITEQATWFSCLKKRSLDINKSPFFGFSSIEQFQAWFGCKKELCKLKDLGFGLVELEVQRLFNSGNQVFYFNDEVKSIRIVK